MYTNLDHTQIIEAVIWLCLRAKRLHTNVGKRTRSEDNYIIISKFKNSADGRKKTIRWSAFRGNDEEEYTFTIDDLVTIISIDLTYSYQSRGKDVFLQTHGCPIGGFLSAIYANVKCAYDEMKFFSDIGPFRDRIYGIRQMDDLILWIAYHRDSLISLTQAKALKERILKYDKTYKGGLELEEQGFNTIDNFTTEHNFAGTIITVRQPSDNTFHLTCKPLNKNLDSVYNDNIQIIPRFIPGNSMVPKHYKTGMQITSYLRMLEQSSNLDILVSAMIDNFHEMRSIGHSVDIFQRSLLSLSQKYIFWAPIAKIFFSTLFSRKIIDYPLVSAFSRLISIHEKNLSHRT